MMDNWFLAFKENGLVGLIMFVIIALLFFVIKWTLQTTKEIMVQAAKERESWQIAITQANKATEGVCQSIQRHDEKAEERGRYVREEHRQMIESLGRINGYTK